MPKNMLSNNPTNMVYSLSCLPQVSKNLHQKEMRTMPDILGGHSFGQGVPDLPKDCSQGQGAGGRHPTSTRRLVPSEMHQTVHPCRQA